jgi:hypothetical protein
LHAPPGFINIENKILISSRQLSIER